MLGILTPSSSRKSISSSNKSPPSPCFSPASAPLRIRCRLISFSSRMVAACLAGPGSILCAIPLLAYHTLSFGFLSSACTYIRLFGSHRQRSARLQMVLRRPQRPTPQQGVNDVCVTCMRCFETYVITCNYYNITLFSFSWLNDFFHLKILSFTSTFVFLFSC